LKVLKLRFKNINSLKGEHLIDFTLPPLSETGIFAIVGPTGAGKSTLLDAITLGLYGRVPRMEKVTKSLVEGKGSVVTHHQGEAWVEVTYKSREEVYVSRWGIRKTNRGNWADYAMELSRYRDGEILEDKKSDVPKLNEQLIGLNYKQFIKSILLSQGEFARFLRATHHERGSLLEELTGTHIYREIGKAVYNKHKHLEAEIKLAESRLSDIQLLDKEALQALKTESSSLTIKIKELKAEMDKLQKWISYKVNLKRLEKEIQSNLANREIIDVQKSKFQASAIRLKRHNQIASYFDDWKELNRLKIQLIQLDDRVEKEKLLISQATLKKKEAIQALCQLTGEMVSEEKFMHDLSTFVDQVKTLDMELEQLRKKGGEERESLIKTIQQNQFPISVSLQGIKDPGKLRLMVDERLNQLTVSELNDQELIRRYDMEGKNLASLKDYIRLSAEVQKLSDQALKIERQERKLRAQVIETEKEQKDLNKKAAELSNNLQALRKKKDEHLKVTSLEEHRSSLKDGEPCPLCGALDHPFALHDTLKEYLTIDLDLEATQIQSKEIQSSIIAVTRRGAELDQLIKNGQKQNEEVLRQISQQEVELNKIREEASHLEDLEWTDVEKVQEKTKALESLLHSLKTQLDHRNEYKYLEDIGKISSKIQETLDSYTVLKKKRNSLFTGQDVNTSAEQLRQRFSGALSAIDKHQHSLAQNEKEILNNKASMLKLEVVLSEVAQKNNYVDLEEMSQHFLDDESFQELNRQALELEKREVSLSDEAKKLEHQKVEINKIPEADQVSLEDLQNKWDIINNERDTYNERLGSVNQQLKNHQELVARFNSQMRDLEDKKSAFRKWQLLNNLIGDASGNRHANFAQELTLQTLIALANERLDKLTDRYLLAPPIQSEEELRVIDRYQGNIPRSTFTLSGGETFIISLALALSLSDLASRNVRLESLFIDEGFGTLDNETLEVALSTLDNLQAESNKTIGVISHVEALKERINTQIKLEKGTSGHSTLSIV
jgi:exonuclease SbcC